MKISMKDYMAGNLGIDEGIELRAEIKKLRHTMERWGIVMTGFTGVTCCNFGDFHHDVEKVMGRPVFTHEFPRLKAEIKEAYRPEFLALMKPKKKGTK